MRGKGVVEREREREAFKLVKPDLLLSRAFFLKLPVTEASFVVLCIYSCTQPARKAISRGIKFNMNTTMIVYLGGSFMEWQLRW